MNILKQKKCLVQIRKPLNSSINLYGWEICCQSANKRCVMSGKSWAVATCQHYTAKIWSIHGAWQPIRFAMVKQPRFTVDMVAIDEITGNNDIYVYTL